MKKARTIEDVIEILDNEDSFETYGDVRVNSKQGSLLYNNLAIKYLY